MSIMQNLTLSEPLKPELPPDTVTDAEANEAAQSLGLTFFNAEKTRKLKKVGLFQTQQGVIQLGVGRLAASDEALQRLLECAVDIATDDREITEARIGAIAAGRSVVEALQKSIQMMADFQSDKLIGGPTVTKKRSFVDEAPVIPIQANQGSQVTVNVVDGTAKVSQTAGT